MESGSGSANACASTAASLAAACTSISAAIVPARVGGDRLESGSPMETEPHTSTEGGAENNPHGKRQKKSTSDVWNFFTKKWDIKIENGVEVKQLWATCTKCSGPRPYKARAESSNGTTAFRNHLKLKHHLGVGQQALSVVKGEDNTATIQTYRYDADVSLKKWQLAICMHDYPFNMVEHEYFVDFIKSLRPSFSFKCRNTTRNNIVEMFIEEKKKLYDHFKYVSSRFSATMDMWTSNQNKGYMCITVHWIDDNWQMQKRIVKFMHVKGSHTGQKLGNEFVKCLMTWNLEKKLFALTLDNASSNDKCVEEVIPTLNKHAQLVCDGIFFHVRCLCHILNLVAQDGLKVIASSVSNIRATIAIVKNSPLQWEEFQKCASEECLDVTRGLTLDVTTRWNSTFLMLKNALYYKKAFDRLLFLHKSRYKKCAPTAEEWDMALCLAKFLKKFHDATELFSGSLYPTANLFWRKFCEMKLAIAEWCLNEDFVISNMANAMQKKYDKYWDKSNISLAVACFLDPRYKHKLVEFFLQKIYPITFEHEHEIAKFIDVVKKLFEAYKISTQEVENPPNARPSGSSHAKDDDLDDFDDDIDDFLYAHDLSHVCKKSELDRYMREAPIRWVESADGQFDILSWWRVKEGIYPILSRLARDVLSIQVSTVASESAFSAGGRVVSKFRTSLEPEVVEALICTKDWAVAGKRAVKEKVASLVDDLNMELEALQINNATMEKDQDEDEVMSGDDSD